MRVALPARRPWAVEGFMKVESLRRRLGEGTSIREYIVEEHLVLHSVRVGRFDLLAIKHHRQLSFDLRGHSIP